MSEDGAKKKRKQVSSQKGSVTREVTNLTRIITVIQKSKEPPSLSDAEAVNEAVARLKNRLQKYEDVLDDFNTNFEPDEKQDETFRIAQEEALHLLDDAREAIKYITAKAEHAKAESSMVPALTTSRLKQANAMKPKETVSLDTRLAEYRDWIYDYEHYHKMANFPNYPLGEQQSFLMHNLSTDLRSQVRLKLKEETQVFETVQVNGKTLPSMADIIRDILARQIPLVTRRIQMLECMQGPAEKFSDFKVRLEDAKFEAEVDKMKTADWTSLMYLRALSNTKLKEHLLRENRVTQEEIETTAESWELAANTRTTSEEKMASVNAMSTYQKSKKGGKPQQQQQKSFSTAASEKSSVKEDDCKNCGRKLPHGNKGCPAKDLTCRGCQKRGHIQKMCRSSGNNTSSDDTSNTGASGEKARARSVKVRRLPISEATTPILEIEAATPSSKDTQKISSIADTGSTKSTMSLDYFKKGVLKKSDIDTTQKAHIEVAGGSKLRCRGTVKLKTKYRDQETILDVLVSPDLKQEMYLSFRDLKKMKLLPESFPQQKQGPGPVGVQLRALKSKVSDLSTAPASPKAYKQNLKIGDSILVQNRFSGKWDTKAQIDNIYKKRGGRFISIVDEYGNIFIRNRKFVRLDTMKSDEKNNVNSPRSGSTMRRCSTRLPNRDKKK